MALASDIEIEGFLRCICWSNDAQVSAVPCSAQLCGKLWLVVFAMRAENPQVLAMILFAAQFRTILIPRSQRDRGKPMCLFTSSEPAGKLCHWNIFPQGKVVLAVWLPSPIVGSLWWMVCQAFPISQDAPSHHWRAVVSGGKISLEWAKRHWAGACLLRHATRQILRDLLMLSTRNTGHRGVLGWSAEGVLWSIACNHLPISRNQCFQKESYPVSVPNSPWKFREMNLYELVWTC